MRVVVQGFAGCPNWSVAAQRVREALAQAGLGDQAVELQSIGTPEEAAAVSFHGSPSILVDGVDLFSDESAPVGFACRMYQTENGPEGAPSISQLVAVASALRRR